VAVVGGGMMLFFNNGDGTFAAGVEYGTSDGANSVAVIDTNDDGELDLVWPEASSGSLWILEANANAAMLSASETSIQAGARGVAIANVDNNSRDDILMTGSDVIQVGLGQALGGFLYENPSTATGSILLGTGDVDGDTVVDIVTSLSASNEVQVFTGGGNGSFSAGTKLAAGAQPDSIWLEDFTGDGELDIVVANNNSGTISRFTGDGMGAFAAQAPYNVGDFLVNVIAADFDADGDVDIIGARLGGPTAAGTSLLANDGSGAFSAPVDTQIMSGPVVAAFGDVTGDGAKDIITANLTTQGITVIPRTP